MSVETSTRTVAGGSVLQITLARTGRRNAIDAAMVDALHRAVESGGREPSLRAVVLASADDAAFCAGADVRIDDAERAYVSDRLYALYERLLQLPVPVVAAVDGPAVGGGAQLVLASDVSIGGPRARFRFAGAGHGLAVSAWGLPLLVGRGRALELCLSMRWVDREEALAIGLLSRAADHPAVAAADLADEIARRDPDAVARLKRLVTEPDLVARVRSERSVNAGWVGGVAGRTAGGEA